MARITVNITCCNCGHTFSVTGETSSVALSQNDGEKAKDKEPITIVEKCPKCKTMNQVTIRP